MKKLLIGLALAVASAAQAQTTSGSLPTEATGAPAPTTSGTPTAQSITTSVKEEPSFLKENFGALFYSENSMPVYFSRNEETGETYDNPITSLWTVGIKYKATKNASVEFQQQALTRSHEYGLSGADATYFQNGKQQVAGDFVLKGNLNTERRLFNSEPMTFSTRYYFPTAYYNRLAHKNGTLRGDIAPEWHLGTRWVFSTPVSPRIAFHNPESKVGSDAIFRMVAGPQMAYNFNDKISAYGNVLTDWRSTSMNRNEVTTDNLALLVPEVGLNVAVGDVTINPCMTSEVMADDASHRIFTADSRVYSYETSSYNLNIYASF